MDRAKTFHATPTCHSQRVGEHDSEGAALDFEGVRRWLLSYTGEKLSCAVTGPGNDGIDRSAFYFGGVVGPLPDGPDSNEHAIFLKVGDEGSICVLDADFVRASARYDEDVEIHSLNISFRGFMLLVSAGPPPR